MDKLIIHISGASGSGKSTLGNKFKTNFKDKIIVKDLDELLDDYFAEHFGKNSSYNLGDVNEELYQDYIDNYISKQTKPIIFVGLNDNFVDFYPKRKDIYYDVHATYGYYIDIDDDIIIKQKCMRFLDNIKSDTNVTDAIIDDNKKFIKVMIKSINTECNKTFIMIWINKWKNDYKRQGYKFMDRDEIYEDVTKILQRALTRSKSPKSKTPKSKTPKSKTPKSKSSTGGKKKRKTSKKYNKKNISRKNKKK